MNNKNCIIWTRVSTKYQEENGGSLDYQKAICERYAHDRGFTIKGYFGGTHESAKTPGVLVSAMLNAVKKDKVGSINSIFYFLHKAAEPFNCLEQDNLA